MGLCNKGGFSTTLSSDACSLPLCLQQVYWFPLLFKLSSVYYHLPPHNCSVERLNMQQSLLTRWSSLQSQKKFMQSLLETSSPRQTEYFVFTWHRNTSIWVLLPGAGLHIISLSCSSFISIIQISLKIYAYFLPRIGQIINLSYFY